MRVRRWNLLLVELLVAVLILAVVLYAINLILCMLTLPPQVKTIAFLIVGLIFLVYLLNLVGVAVPGL